MTKEEIWEKLATEAKLRGFSPASYHTCKANISLFLDWSNKPYEVLDEEDFRNYLKLLQSSPLRGLFAIRFFDRWSCCTHK